MLPQHLKKIFQIILLIFLTRIESLLFQTVDVRGEHRCDPLEFDLIPVPGHCSKFYKCPNGYLYILSCPRGLVFNSAQKMCDHMYNVIGPCGTHYIEANVKEAIILTTSAVRPNYIIYNCCILYTDYIFSFKQKMLTLILKLGIVYKNACPNKTRPLWRAIVINFIGALMENYS